MAGRSELVVCTTCSFPGPGNGSVPPSARDGLRLSQALEAAGIAHRRQECLSACTRGCAVVLRGAGRWTYVQGGLNPDRDLADLIAIWRAYAATDDGIVPWRQRPEVIRRNTIARTPPFEV